MIDLRKEQLLSLTDAARVLPAVDGKKPHISTLWRWCKKGIRGVSLEYVRLGNRICTSHEALSRFANALAEAESVVPVPPRQPAIPHSRSEAQRARDVEAAERELEKAGI